MIFRFAGGEESLMSRSMLVLTCHGDECLSLTHRQGMCAMPDAQRTWDSCAQYPATGGRSDARARDSVMAADERGTQ